MLVSPLDWVAVPLCPAWLFSVDLSWVISEGVSGNVSCLAASCWSENGAECGRVQMRQVLVLGSDVESRT